MIKRIILIVSLFLAANIISGCAAAPIVPVLGVSYQGYTFWKGRESTRYYASNLETTYEAVKRSCEQLKLETIIQNPASKDVHSLETKGNHPMQINVMLVEINLTRVVITIDLFGDKQYVDLFYKTIDDNIPKKEVIDNTQGHSSYTSFLQKKYLIKGWCTGDENFGMAG